MSPSLGAVMQEETDELRAALASMTQERDAAYRRGLERAAELLAAESRQLWKSHSGIDNSVAGILDEAANLIRAEADKAGVKT